MDFRSDFARLKGFGADPDGGWSRLAFSAADNQAHDWLLAEARAAGLGARYDAFGNAILRLEGRGPKFLIGSHLDSVQRGGAFDGAIGVLAGLSVLKQLKAEGWQGRAIEVIAFRDEEGRFGPFTGSRAMAGLHDEAALARARAADGTELAPLMQAAGFTPANAPYDFSDVAFYLELHIEQGPVLEAAGIPLGLVTAIAGQERLALRFTGQADHAGTAPMDLRRDALAGAARFATEFRAMIRAANDPDLRGTIGVFSVAPNQGNVVPGEVRLGLELRGPDGGQLLALRGAVEQLAESVATDEKLDLRIRRVYSDQPVPMDATLAAAMSAAAKSEGVATCELLSGANHDAGIIGRIVHALMLFVPSVGGRSHCPEEESDLAHIEAAIRVMLRMLRQV